MNNSFTITDISESITEYCNGINYNCLTLTSKIC